MNNGQSYVVATGVVMLIILTVFMLPWRIERTGNLRWGPFYRAPITYERVQAGNSLRSTIRYEKADLSFGILGLELVALFVACTGLYQALANDEDEQKHQVFDQTS